MRSVNPSKSACASRCLLCIGVCVVVAVGIVACGARSDLGDRVFDASADQAQVDVSLDPDGFPALDSAIDHVLDGQQREACTAPVPIDAGWRDGGTTNWGATTSKPSRVVRDHEGRWIVSGGFQEAFFQTFDPDGQPIVSKKYGDTRTQRFEIGAVASDDSLWGVVYIGPGGLVDFGGGPIAGPAGALVHLTRTGGLLAQRVWPALSGSSVAPTSVVVLSNDDVVVEGTIHGSYDIGGGPLSTSADSAIFLARYRSCGEYLFGKVFGNAGSQYASMTTDGSDRLYLFGGFSEKIDFGGGALVAPTPGWDIAIAKLDSNGGHIASREFKTRGDFNFASGLAVDGDSNVIVVGAFNPTIDFGNGPVATAGSRDGYIVRLSPSLGTSWARTFGNAQDQIALAVDIDANESPVVTGAVNGTVDFGGGPVSGSTQRQLFLARYSATGNFLSAAIASTSSCCWSEGNSLLTADVGRVVVAGGSSGSFSFGSTVTGLGAGMLFNIAVP